MRVLYFTRNYTPHDHRFLSALAQESGLEVFSLRLEQRGQQREDRPLPASIEQIPWRGGHSPARLADGPALLGDLKRILRRVHPDLVHAGTLQTSAFLTALSGFRPLVSMSWGSDLLKDTDRNAAWHWATRYTLQHSAALVGDCEAVRQKAASLGFDPQRVITFPWGIDLEHFHPSSNVPSPDAPFVVLSTRSWEPIYGVDVLVRGFCLAAREEPRLHLILLGGGSQAALLRQMIADFGMEERVTFAGLVNYEQLADFHRRASLYVSASHSDGTSISLLEALACGTPVLVSDIPGNQEWIRSGETGWLFRDGDSAALAQAILHAAQSLEEIRILRSSGRRLAEERADWKKNFRKLLDAYQLAVSTP